MIVGIDTGVSGAVATLNGQKVTVVPCPLYKGFMDVQEMRNLLNGVPKPQCVFIEDYRIFTKSRMKALRTVIGCLFTWVTICECHALSYQLVAPNDWQKEMLRQMPRKTRPERKRSSMIVARRLFPTVSIQDDNQADALLIAEYGRRLLGR